MSKDKKKRHVLRNVLIILLLILIIAYVALVNVLVSAALKPSFMEKLDAFQEITEKSYSEQVQSEEIDTNRNESIEATRAWLAESNGRKVSMTSEDGLTLIAAMFPSEGADFAGSRWAVLLHGYTGWKEEMYMQAYWFHQQGYNVLVPDLRAQGESEGEYIGMGYTDKFDVCQWVEFIIADYPDAEIALVGQSMGAATAIMTSNLGNLPDNVKCVVSDCAYTDAYSMFEAKIQDWFGLPAFPLVDSAVIMLKLRGQYDLMEASAIDAISETEIPTLIIHGEEDKMIPVSMAYELYDACSAEKELLIVPGAGHAQAADVDPEGYYATVLEFINKYIE